MYNSNLNVTFYPLISSIQKIALYETKTHFYLIGSNNTLTNFRVLKIDRLVPKDLVILDDKIKYNQNEIRELVTIIDNSNKNQKSPANGLTKVVSAFGIIGFVRFLEGYYIILITKRRRVAVIGHHTVYKVEDTTMIYLPSDSVRIFHPDEQRYVKMFQSIDLSSNFYFSYSYDLTHTLQNNMSVPKGIIANETTNPDFFFNKEFKQSTSFFNTWSFLEDQSKIKNKPVTFGIRNNPNSRFIWNEYLLNKIKKNLHKDWILYIIHGFIGQSNISVFGRSLYITVIARRSNKFAGTRFLKRGANFTGDVANEVETEQIVQDIGVGLINSSRFSSFVQMRGSVPGNWSQDISKMVPKPIITIDLSDPFSEVAGAHFKDLFKRYGSPIIILNLVKKREKKKHESILSKELNFAVRYLNQFLPLEFNIQCTSFDMARKNKGKEANVMKRLANIANTAVVKTGIFLTLDFSLHSQKLTNDAYSENEDCTDNRIKINFSKKNSLQTGIIRTNCVDCLDRTNTAQFVIGKCALGYQLHALGILNSPKLEFDSDCVRMLEELYEDHGDTLALQYGGSQLVHRIKTYRKTAPWTSQGNDIMQTLSRYYSNTFSDQEKQQTINLFLGLFVPEEGKPPVWEYFTDYYFHHKPACEYLKKNKILTQWWHKRSMEYFPHAVSEVSKTCIEIVPVQSITEEVIDIYYDYYRPYELSLLSEIYAYQISHSVRDFMPNFTTDFSPFSVRVRPGKRREEAGNKMANIKNPSLTGQSSTSSTASSTSSSLSTSDEEDNQFAIDSQMTTSKNSLDTSFEILFPAMKLVYGIQPTHPKRYNVQLYKKFVLLNKSATFDVNRTKHQYKPSIPAAFFNASNLSSKSYEINNDMNKYKHVAVKYKLEEFLPIPSDVFFYERYAHQQQLYLGIVHPDIL